MASYIQVAGKSSLLVGFPDDDYATLDILGEQMDDTQISIQPIYHSVPGDAQGGPQGEPIEEQILALDVRGQFNLSNWDPAVVRQIRKFTMTNDGILADSEIGALMKRDRSIRIYVHPAKSNPIAVGQQDAGADHFAWNFPCCLVTTPIETGQGTKFSACRFAFRAYRTPAGHGTISSDTVAGTYYNKDDAGVATALGL